MDNKFVIAQVLALCGTILYFISFQCKNNRKMFAVQFFSYLAYTIHFFLLGAGTGGFSYLLNLTRSLFLASKWEFARSKKMCVMLCLLQGVVLKTTWAGWISLLPVCANIATTIGGYTHNAQKMRIATMLFNSPLWIIYDILVGSWMGALDEISSEISSLISIFRFGWKNLKDVND